MQQQGMSSYGGGSGAGRVEVHDMTVTKFVDVATPKLFDACAAGLHIPSALLTVRKAGKEQQEYFTIILKELLISSVQIGSGKNPLGTPEVVTLNFAGYEVTYKQQQADGTLGGPVKSKFNLKTHQNT